MPIRPLYRVQVHEVWREGRTPDPVTYWLTRDEAITLIDSIAEHAERSPETVNVGVMTVTPFWQIVQADEERLEWSEDL